MKASLVIVVFLALLGIVLAESINVHRVPDNSLLLRDVETLTLHRGKSTKARRVEGVQQLSCHDREGSALCNAYAPDVVQCVNKGTNDKQEVQWKCEAELDKNVRFGRMDVSCEGYHSAEDPYVLVGSCGLEYELERTTPYHRDPLPPPVIQPGKKKVEPAPVRVEENKHQHESSSLGPVIVCLLLALVAVYICCRGDIGIAGNSNSVTHTTRSSSSSSTDSDNVVNQRPRPRPEAAPASKRAKKVVITSNTTTTHHHHPASIYPPPPLVPAPIPPPMMPMPPAPYPSVLFPATSVCSPPSHVTIIREPSSFAGQRAPSPPQEGETRVAAGFAGTGKREEAETTIPEVKNIGETSIATGYGGTRKR